MYVCKHLFVCVHLLVCGGVGVVPAVPCAVANFRRDSHGRGGKPPGSSGPQHAPPVCRLHMSQETAVRPFNNHALLRVRTRR